MEWLMSVSKLVAKEGQPMTWITPLGLPVLQPYRRKDKYQVRVRRSAVQLSGTLARSCLAVLLIVSFEDLGAPVLR